MKEALKIKYDLIVKDYLNGVTVKDIAIKYNYNNSTAIFGILDKLNIPKRTKKWTKEMIVYLMDNYSHEKWETILIKLTPFNQEEIIHKAYSLKINLKREVYYYSLYEISILIKHYETMKVKDIIKLYLPKRSEFSISSKAAKLGLVSREKWSIEDTNLLIEIYQDYSNKDLINMYFPNRTKNSLQSQAEKYFLTKTCSQLQYTEEFLIEKLIDYSKQLGRTPFGHEVMEYTEIPSLSTYHRYFGSYSNACRESGLEINNSLFGVSSHYIASNGDSCFSKAELLITEALLISDIIFQKEANYKDVMDDPNCGHRRCDWLVGNKVIIEYFGMPEKEIYRNKMEFKRKLCKINNITLLEFFKEDLKDMNKIINKISSHITKSVTTTR